MNVILVLFFTFLKIGLFSIGGGYAIIPLIQEQVVEKTGWISEKVFTDIITISQMTPGPLAVNTSTFVGLQIAGVAGAIAATLGCVLCGVLLSLMLYRFFQRHQKSIYVFEVLGGLKAASLGLIISAAVTILMLALWGIGTPTFDTMPDWFIATMFALSLLALRKWKVNHIIIMIGTGLLGFFIY
mgnify:CR=1 FL=1